MSEETKEYDVSDELIKFSPKDYDVQPGTSVARKIVRLMELIGSIPKDKSNDFHAYRYLSAAGILGKVQPALVQLGLVARQSMYLAREEWVEVKENRKQHLVIVRCVLTIEDSETGETVSVQSFGSGMDSNDKAIMKAQTAAHKYAWMHLLNISTDDDPEADSAVDHATSSPAVSIPSPLPVGEILSVKTKVFDVRKKTANEKSPFLISTDQGDFTTWNKDISIQAELAKGLGAPFEFDYKVEMYKGVAEKKIIDPPKKKETN